MKKNLMIGLLLSFTANLAMAHSGHGLETAFAGFMHPFTGIDHLLVMVAIGLWAAKSGGSIRWQLPFVFVFSMLIGAVLGANLVVINGLEVLIALSVVVMGLMLNLHFHIHKLVQFVATAMIALLHGLAHGMELQANVLQTNAQWSVLLAMMMATALLHATGYWFGAQRQMLFARLQQIFALALVLIGGYLLAV
jgi:urease accessory protein